MLMVGKDFMEWAENKRAKDTMENLKPHSISTQRTFPFPSMRGLCHVQTRNNLRDNRGDGGRHGLLLLAFLPGKFMLSISDFLSPIFSSFSLSRRGRQKSRSSCNLVHQHNAAMPVNDQDARIQPRSSRPILSSPVQDSMPGWPSNTPPDPCPSMMHPFQLSWAGPRPRLCTRPVEAHVSFRGDASII